MNALRAARRVPKIALSRRCIHNVPRLRNQTSLDKEGVPGLYTAKGFETVWTQYQQHILDKLNRVTIDTDNESRIPFQILLNTATKADSAHVFNYASQAHNNHMFVESLRSPLDNKTRPSAQLEKRISNQFGSMQQFKEEFLATAESMNGAGWVFLVEDEGKNIGIFACYNAGSPYTAARSQLADLNTLVSADTQRLMSDVEATVEAGIKNYNMVLLALNLWEHAYIEDYGFDKKTYVERWWASIDWDVVSSRLFG